MKHNTIRILVVDDEMAEEIKENLEDFMFHKARLAIDHAVTCAEAEQKVNDLKTKECFYDIMVVDMKMGSTVDSETKGLDILRLSTSAIKIVLTGQPSIENCLASVKAGAYDYIGKIDNAPYERLMNTIRQGLEERLNQLPTLMEKWLSENRQRLHKQYETQHIAVIDGIVVDTDHELAKLQNRVKIKYPYLAAFYTYISKD